MVNILPENPSFGTQFARSLGAGVSQGIGQGMHFAQEMSLQKAKQKQDKQLEKQNSLQLGLETVGKMRSLISSAGPSNYVKGLYDEDTIRDRAELESLGRSLIPLVAAGVPIRNQREFDEYRKIITNPNSRQAEFEGALNGLEGLFERSLTQSDQKEAVPKKQGKIKFNSQNREHKAKAEQLYKTYKDKEKVREALSREFEF